MIDNVLRQQNENKPTGAHAAAITVGGVCVAQCGDVDAWIRGLDLAIYFVELVHDCRKVFGATGRGRGCLCAGVTVRRDSLSVQAHTCATCTLPGLRKYHRHLHKPSRLNMFLWPIRYNSEADRAFVTQKSNNTNRYMIQLWDPFRQ